MNEPQYILPEYRELFKRLRPEDLQFPEWLQRKLQSSFCYSQWGPHLRAAVVACLQESVVRTDDDFVIELALRFENEANARRDLVRVLAKIAEKKAIPFDEFVNVQFDHTSPMANLTPHPLDDI